MVDGIAGEGLWQNFVGLLHFLEARASGFIWASRVCQTTLAVLSVLFEIFLSRVVDIARFPTEQDSIFLAVDWHASSSSNLLMLLIRIPAKLVVLALKVV